MHRTSVDMVSAPRARSVVAAFPLVLVLVACEDRVLLFRTTDASSEPVALTEDTRTSMTGSEIGTPFEDACASGEALVGLDGFVQTSGFELVTGISGTCATLRVEGASVVAVDPRVLPFHGDAEFGVPFSLACPSNQVAIGIAGNAGTAIDGLTLLCAPLTVVGASIEIGAATRLTDVGGHGGTLYDLPCADGQIARGRFGYSDTVLEGIGLLCATPTR